MKKTIKNSISSTILLAILVFSIVAYVTPFAQADYSGIGKYLTIYTGEGGSVTATKVKSGTAFLFDQSTAQIKVGAGTVLLKAEALEGWEFVEWTGDLGDTNSEVEFKTFKYATITAVFREKTHTITASSSEGGSIVPDGSWEVNHGDDQTIFFNADSELTHLSSIIVDGVFGSSFNNSYTFENVVEAHSISVSFSPIGTATVPSGSGVSVFLGEGAGITFVTTDGGVATGGAQDFPAGTSVVVWELNYGLNLFDGGAQVALQYDATGLTIDQELALRLIRGDTLEALYSDVDGDLDVDGTDVSIIANAVNTNQQPHWYDPLFDIDNDGEVDNADIHIVNENKGALLEDITDWVDTDLNIIYGTTEHFSIFRGR